MRLETIERAGQGWRGNLLVCSHLEVIERIEHRVTGVPTPGRGVQRVPRSARHPTTVRFLEILDEDLRRELETLLSGARDVATGRRLRDAGWAAKPIDVRLEDDREYSDCVISRPINPHGALETLEFTLTHPQL